jgi:type I restriction enzyme M protein
VKEKNEHNVLVNKFAAAESKKAGQLYTPRCVVQLLVEGLAPHKGRVFDPCSGSGGIFVQSVEFGKAHANGNGGKAEGHISIFGREGNPARWRLARMKLAIPSIEGNLGPEPADSFHRNRHKDLKTDYILANPPFNMSDGGGDRVRDDMRWRFGVQPVGEAKYASVPHFSEPSAANSLQLN